MNKKILPILISILLFSGCVVNQKIQDKNTDTIVSEELSIPQNIVLDLSNQNLTKLPDNIFKQTNLKKLDLSGNNLTGALPGEIRFLQKLEVLNISGNKMTGVPAEVGQLSNLRVLDLSNNQLTGLPYELGNLKNLKVLNLSGNNYSEQDLAVILKGLSSDVEVIK